MVERIEPVLMVEIEVKVEIELVVEIKVHIRHGEMEIRQIRHFETKIMKAR